LIIPIANVHHSSKRSRRSPVVGIVCTGRGSRSDPTAGRPTQATSGDVVCFGVPFVCPVALGYRKREVFMGCISFHDEALLRRSSTANARDVQSLSRPAAVLLANPFWRKDWRKTSFLRRCPMPRGQAWQS
jgi:hypothetical protein